MYALATAAEFFKDKTSITAFLMDSQALEKQRRREDLNVTQIRFGDARTEEALLCLQNLSRGWETGRKGHRTWRVYSEGHCFGASAGCRRILQACY